MTQTAVRHDELKRSGWDAGEIQDVAQMRSTAGRAGRPMTSATT